MNNIELLRETFDNFTKATATLQKAYANLEEKFENINREMAAKNLELEKTIAEKEDVKNFLQNILESLSNGVIVTDLRGNIETMNRCAGLYISLMEGDVKGKHISSLFEEISDSVWQKIYFSDYHPDEAGYKVKVNGRTLELFATPLHGRSGEAIGTVFILRDVSRIEKLEEMAKRTEKFTAMGEMAANIAHEIRNPLGSIELFASLLLKDLPDAKNRERVAKIVMSVKNMDHKISNLLMFTKTELPRSGTIDVHSLLKETLLFAEQLAMPGNIVYSSTYADSPLLVWGDEEMLKQVFLNLILNAFQAMPESGNLHIETRCSQSAEKGSRGTTFLEIIFTDDGQGIEPEHLSRIFDPFFTTREGAAGLGLAIVHNILEMHQGAIHVERGSSVGSVFTILLPLLESAGDDVLEINRIR